MTLSQISLALVGLVLAGAALGWMQIPTVDAAHSGKACLSIVDNSCPSTPQLFGGLPGSRIHVNVVVDRADSFDGFSAWVRADPAVIKPVQVDMTGSVLKGASATLQCVNDCTNWLSGGPGSVAEAANGRSTGFLTTGLLFSIDYLVVGNISSSSPISLYYTVSPSGWETNGVYLHFTSGCDTSYCWFVPTQDATFRVGTAGTGQPFLASFAAGIYKSFPLFAIAGGIIALGIVLVSLLFRRQRSRTKSLIPSTVP